MRLNLTSDIVNHETYRNTVAHLRALGVRLPTFAELADPAVMPDDVTEALPNVDPRAADPRNLYRIHWYNDSDQWNFRTTPDHLLLPPELTQVQAPIAVLLGERFPMIDAHKVLAAYCCLVPRLITGQFDPTWQRTIWPSTGNYCRGGVAISRILGSRSIAVLPEGMSRERFAWLEEWLSDPHDIVRTVGSESNIKEIYDACRELTARPENVVINQFSDFGNYLGHAGSTARAGKNVIAWLQRQQPELRLRAFVAGTGSSGTLGAGDVLKEDLGARVAAVEPVECPTLLYNGFGPHNIQGIGDKHVPLIHNVTNTDFIVGVHERACEQLNVLFNNALGRNYLIRRQDVSAEVAAGLSSLGPSGIANVLGAIKLAQHLDLGADDLILTVATDGAGLYGSERQKVMARDFPCDFDEVSAAEVYAHHILGCRADHLLELTHSDKQRVFNLGYYTWVEQQGLSLEDFEARRSQSFWRELRELLPVYDRGIMEMNAAVGWPE